MTYYVKIQWQIIDVLNGCLSSFDSLDSEHIPWLFEIRVVSWSFSLSVESSVSDVEYSSEKRDINWYRIYFEPKNIIYTVSISVQTHTNLCFLTRWRSILFNIWAYWNKKKNQNKRITTCKMVAEVEINVLLTTLLFYIYQDNVSFNLRYSFEPCKFFRNL